MKSFVVAAVAAFGLMGVANAADMPVKSAVAPMAVAAPVYNWSGFYLGYNAGFGTGNVTGGIYPAFFGRNPDIDGALLGGQIGYNYQMHNWVVGLEGDLDWANIQGASGVVGINVNTQLKTVGTVRGRVGYAWNRALVYGTAGWAWASATASGAPLAPESNTHNGYALGAGLEYGIAPNWSVKGEYLYVHLGEKNYFISQGCPGPCNIGANVSTFRVGLNWRPWGM